MCQESFSLFIYVLSFNLLSDSMRVSRTECLGCCLISPCIFWRRKLRVRDTKHTGRPLLVVSCLSGQSAQSFLQRMTCPTVSWGSVHRLIPAWIDASLQTALHLFILQGGARWSQCGGILWKCTRGRPSGSQNAAHRPPGLEEWRPGGSCVIQSGGA